MTQLQPTSQESLLVQALEAFTDTADAFLQNYYIGGADADDIEKILKAIATLNLDVDVKKLEAEFDLNQDKKIMSQDYFDSAWVS